MLRDNAERIGLDLTKKDISGRTGDDWNRQRDLNDEQPLSAREKRTSKIYQNFCTKNECCRIFNPYPKSNVPARLEKLQGHLVPGRIEILSDEECDYPTYEEVDEDMSDSDMSDSDEDFFY